MQCMICVINRIWMPVYSLENMKMNLESSNFPPEKLKELYHRRWGIEISFRELKYALGLTCFHSKNVE